MSERLSIRAYSRHRGVSDAAVRKAIATGRITVSSDGTIEPQLADVQWSKNTDVAQQRGKRKAVPNEALASLRETLGEPPAQSGSTTGGTTLLQAKTANEVLKAQTNKLRLARLKGELVQRNEAIAHIYKLARAERDAWLNWPTRIAAQMASELNVDSHQFLVLLEKAIRLHLTELGELAVGLE